MLSHAALLPIFRLSKARGGRIPEVVCYRQATPERRKRRNPEDASALDGLRRCSLLTPQPRDEHARRSRLATHSKALVRDVAGSQQALE